MIQKNNRFKIIWTFDSANNLCGNISADLVLPSINENVSYNFRYFRWFSAGLGHPPPRAATRVAGQLGSPALMRLYIKNGATKSCLDKRFGKVQA